MPATGPSRGRGVARQTRSAPYFRTRCSERSRHQTRAHDACSRWRPSVCSSPRVTRRRRRMRSPEAVAAAGSVDATAERGTAAARAPVAQALAGHEGRVHGQRLRPEPVWRQGPDERRGGRLSLRRQGPVLHDRPRRARNGCHANGHRFGVRSSRPGRDQRRRAIVSVSGRRMARSSRTSIAAGSFPKASTETVFGAEQVRPAGGMR